MKKLRGLNLVECKRCPSRRVQIFYNGNPSAAALVYNKPYPAGTFLMRTYHLILGPTTQKSLVRIFDKLRSILIWSRHCIMIYCIRTLLLRLQPGVRVCIQLGTCHRRYIFIVSRPYTYCNTTTVVHHIRRIYAYDMTRVNYMRTNEKNKNGGGKKRRDINIKNRQDVDLGHFCPSL